MSKTIQTIDLFRWSEPDEQRRVKKLGTANAKEVFEKLNTHLEENNLLPDEYFLFSESNFTRFDGELPTDTADITYEVDYGDSEGIYLDINIRTAKYEQVHFATGKTLGETTEDFLRMSRIGAECALMLNNGGYKIEMKETPEIAFKLNPEEETLYSIIDKNGNDTLLKRTTLKPESDPTPFILASGVKTENGLIEWDSGRYFSSFNSAVKEFQNNMAEAQMSECAELTFPENTIANKLITPIHNEEYDMMIDTFRKYAQSMMYPDPTCVVMSAETEAVATKAVNDGMDIYTVFSSLKGEYEYDDDGCEYVEFPEAEKAKQIIGTKYISERIEREEKIQTLFSPEERDMLVNFAMQTGDVDKASTVFEEVALVGYGVKNGGASVEYDNMLREAYPEYKGTTFGGMDKDGDGIPDRIDSAYNPPERYPEEKYGYQFVTAEQLKKLSDSGIDYESKLDREHPGQHIVRFDVENTASIKALLKETSNILKR